MLHSKIRRDARSMIVHGHLPNVKHGGKVKANLKEKFQDYVDFTSKDRKKKTFMPTEGKQKKSKMNLNETFGGSFERWDSQKAKEIGRKKDNYIKSKDIDHTAIIEKMQVPFESLKITGSRKLLIDPTSRAQVPEEITLNQNTIQWLLRKNSYISTEVVDAGLILLDKRLNDDSHMKEIVSVYTVQNLRLILQGTEELVSGDKFVAILPRDFGFSSESSRLEVLSKGGRDLNAPGSHYTLVSNLRCNDAEVNVYETFAPYRDPDNLLTSEGKKCVKILAKSEKLTVNCVNVQLQDESECGAISLALAVQLCFFPDDGVAIYSKMKDARSDLYRCLIDDEMNYFHYTKKAIKPNEKVLFSINV